MPDTNLFDDDFFKKLRLLKFMVQRLLGAGAEGERISRKRGGNIEFKDYRKYSPGDETRYIDWNLFGRTERLYVKEFSKEDAFPIYLLLDQTTSMQPKPARRLGGKGKQILSTKFVRARHLVAALGYVSLIASHPTQVIGFSWTEPEAILSISPVFHRVNELMPLLKLLQNISTRNQTNLAAVLKQIHATLRQRGLLIIISDLFDQGNVSGHMAARHALLQFRARGFEVCIIHTLAQPEEVPAFRGWVNLKDAETNESQFVFASEDTIEDYRTHLNRFAEDWRRFCLNHEIKYFYVNDLIPLEKVVFDFLRRGGLLK